MSPRLTQTGLCSVNTLCNSLFYSTAPIRWYKLTHPASYVECMQRQTEQSEVIQEGDTASVVAWLTQHLVH